MALSKRVTITLDGRQIPTTKQNLKLVMEIMAPDNLHPNWWIDDRTTQAELLKMLAESQQFQEKR
jgi:hypothetical protein